MAERREAAAQQVRAHVGGCNVLRGLNEDLGAVPQVVAAHPWQTKENLAVTRLDMRPGDGWGWQPGRRRAQPNGDGGQGRRRGDRWKLGEVDLRGIGQRADAVVLQMCLPETLRLRCRTGNPACRARQSRSPGHCSIPQKAHTAGHSRRVILVKSTGGMAIGTARRACRAGVQVLDWVPLASFPKPLH